MSPLELLDAIIIPLLRTGIVSPERQIAMADDLAKLSIEHRKMLRTFDELISETIEQDELDRAPPSATVYRFPQRGHFAADAGS